MIRTLARAPLAVSILLTSTLVASMPAAAHDDGTILRHGGRLAEAGAFHMELVARGETVEVFVSDADGRPVPAAGFKGVAVLVSDGRPARIPLAPAGPDRLGGTAPFALGVRPKGAVRLTTPGGATASGTFD